MPIMRLGEQLIREEPVAIVKNGQTLSGGKLLLTNQRIIYEMQEGGGFLRAGSTRTVLDEGLSTIQNVSESKPLIKIPFVTKNILRIEFSDSGAVDFAVKDPTSWKGMVIQTRQSFDGSASSEVSRREDREFQRELALRQAGSSQINIGGGYGAPQASGGGTKGCIYCGKDIPAAARFCPHCKQSQN